MIDYRDQKLILGEVGRKPSKRRNGANLPQDCRSGSSEFCRSVIRRGRTGAVR